MWGHGGLLTKAGKRSARNPKDSIQLRFFLFFRRVSKPSPLKRASEAPATQRGFDTASVFLVFFDVSRSQVTKAGKRSAATQSDKIRLRNFLVFYDRKRSLRPKAPYRVISAGYETPAGRIKIQEPLPSGWTPPSTNHSVPRVDPFPPATPESQTNSRLSGAFCQFRWQSGCRPVMTTGCH